MIKKNPKRIARKEGSPKISFGNDSQSPSGKVLAKLPILNKSLSKADSNFRTTFNNTGMGKPGILPKLPNQSQSVAKLKQLQAAMH